MQTLFACFGGVALLGMTIVLVRRGTLAVRYGMVWAGASLVVLVLAALLGSVRGTADALGFTPTGFIFAFVVTCLVLACLQLSVSLSKLHEQIRTLSEANAFLEHRFESLVDMNIGKGILRATATSPGDGQTHPALEHERDMESTRTGISTDEPAVGTPLVVIPALNEAASVGRVVHDVRALGYEVVVVDDGSSDDTAGEARRAGATVLRLPVNLGVGGALRLGFRYATSAGFSVVVHCDADGQHDPGEIQRLLVAMEHSGADMAVGSRFAGLDPGYRVGMVRRSVMRLLARIASRATREHLTDVTSGFRSIRSPLLEEFAVVYPAEYLGDTVEALIEAGRTGYKVTETPVRMSPRTFGESTATAISGTWHLLRVLVVIGLTAGRRRPLPSGRRRRG